MNFSPKFRWEVELEPGLVWRTVLKNDRELFDRFWGVHRHVIAESERFHLGNADTWLEGEAFDEDDVRTILPKVISFAVAVALNESVAIQTRFMVFANRDDGPTPGPHSNFEDWVRTTQFQGWSSSVPADNEESRERIRKSYRDVRRAFTATADHAFLRAVARYRGAVFSQFVEATAILLCASLEALGMVEDEKGQTQVKKRLIPRYSKNEGSEREVMNRLYRLRDASAHGLVHRLKTRGKRGQALRQGFELTRLIIRNALSDDELHVAASKGPDAMKAYLDSPHP
jgi:hypothetical protein